MARRFNVAVAATAALALGVAGCSSPSSNNDATGGNTDSGKITQQANATDPNAKGPAKEIEGARPGGVLNVQAQTTPNTFDPTDIYYVDSNQIGKLLFRTPTQFDIRDGKPTLVPDLTDLGTPSADKLTWTFKMQPGIKYEDGTEVKVEDLAYAIKRSFAHDIYVNGPTYQLSYFKDGDKYKGPYKDGDNYAGVETQGTDTLIVKLAKPFQDLPFFMTFPMFTPIPKAKDTRQEYKNKPLATGPYKFKSYQAGTSLVLEKNTNWDPNTDPARHQYLDGFNFQWGGDAIKSQQAILNSNGQDANAINYDVLDASLIPQLTGEKKNQLVQGESPCTIVWQLDSRKIPLEVRKAIAKAYPNDQLWKAYGLNEYVAEAASTVMPPSVPGYEKYTPVPDLTGTGAGDPAAAKAMLEAAGKVGFEVSYYYDNTKPVQQQLSQIRSDALTKAGFKVKPIGVSTADLRTKKGDYDAPVNMGQSPAGWCSDWPAGGSWFPVLFRSQSIAEGQSWGMLSDKALDKEINDTANLPADQSTPKWAALDKKIMEQYVAIPWYYDKLAVVQGTNVGTTTGDPTMGMPNFSNMYLKS
ncbi:ABC transporter substrate-binding protein [Paractinoplanes abujensis]|uniref:Peptide/nickel transport system substrate-binding protein n=1 Tax=Paractinoplanes abujensis TaxID=882441 RepID=A0A7W7CZY2_9ACTN|nr:ABC transporter substrate-binding protein [Actinoplanes abujensis]MBB4697708.1 peptide/nickel transport system substrate-binding protein [Actinoplanes abujensis]